MIDLCVGKYDDLQYHKRYTPNKCIHVQGPKNLDNIYEEVRVISLEGADWDLLAYVENQAEMINARVKNAGTQG